MTKTRLYRKSKLTKDMELTFDGFEFKYLHHVLRFGVGDLFYVFSEESGEWHCQIEKVHKKYLSARLIEQTRSPREITKKLSLIFAPIKSNRMPMLFEKATELGVDAFWPAIMDYSVAKKINYDKCFHYCREAAELSERLTLPIIEKEQSFVQCLSSVKALCEDHDQKAVLLFFDEARGGMDISDMGKDDLADYDHIFLLIGPEGGFSEYEKNTILQLPSLKVMTLGDRILRAETAGLKAIAVIAGLLGK